MTLLRLGHDKIDDLIGVPLRRAASRRGS